MNYVWAQREMEDHAGTSGTIFEPSLDLQEKEERGVKCAKKRGTKIKGILRKHSLIKATRLAGPLLTVPSEEGKIHSLAQTLLFSTCPPPCAHAEDELQDAARGAHFSLQASC